MLNSEQEYMNATKYARINIDDKKKMRVSPWIINSSLFSLLVLGSSYTYMHFGNNLKSHLTAVMGVSHINKEDENLMLKLSNIEADSININQKEITVSEAMSKIVNDYSSKNSSVYVEELAREDNSNRKLNKKNLTFEKRISEELKLIN